MEYYSTLKKKVVLPFVTACMSLEGIKLSEINQSEKDSYITPMWILKKKKKLSAQKQRVEWWLPRAGEQKKWGEVGKRGEKMVKF